MDGFPTIKDFDDETFDPLEDETGIWGSCYNVYEVLNDAFQKGGPVQPGSFRVLAGMPQDINIGDNQSFVIFSTREIQAVLSDPQTYSNDIFKPGFGAAFGNSLTQMNPPEHTKYRRIFQKAFFPGAIAEWSETLIQPVMDELIGKFKHRGKAELIREFAFPYPFEIIYRQLELPPADTRTFHKLAVAESLFQVDLEKSVEAGRKLGEYFQALLNIRRKKPGKDLISVLSQIEDEGEQLPDDVVVSFFRQLISAAGDTTYRSTGNMLVGLLHERPDQYQMLVRDRSLIPNAIEETMRWYGPINVTQRTVMRDVELCGIKIPAGSIIEAATGLVGRNPETFSNPDQFDITRQNAHWHMGFSHGPHICLGQSLARLEMSRALAALLDNFPKLRLDPDHPPPRIQGYSMLKPKEIHVRFD
jgi:cytochrome P450